MRHDRPPRAVSSVVSKNGRAEQAHSERAQQNTRPLEGKSGWANEQTYHETYRGGSG